MACPDENALVEFFAGRLPPAAQTDTALHVDTCDSCRRVVSAIALATGARPPAPTGLGPGDELGRYRVEATLGAGAMGVVYRARDVQLGRAVALKVLHPGRLVGLEEDEARARALREAQAMARLSHPNVVAVYDFGEHLDQVWLAMELREGDTLAAWLAAGRGRREILRAFGQAAQGLCAAHAAGLVHRDFKPQNVLMDEDGRVRVTDFGLARVGNVEPGGGAESSNASPSAQASPELTRTGVWVGTPRYMAPEQFKGRADARSDQFAFCVALPEALCGRRPFAGETAPEVVAALHGPPPPRPASVPRWLFSVLRRGLSAEPSRRFEDMGSLLHALRAAERRARVVRVAAPALAMLVAAAGGALVVGRAPVPPAPPSGVAEEALEVIRLRAGATTEITESGLHRVAVGDPSIVDVRVRGGVLTLVGGTPGMTTLLVWRADGQRSSRIVRVFGATPEPAL